MKIQLNLTEKDTEIEVSSPFLRNQRLGSDQRAIAEVHAADMESESSGCC